MIATSFSVECQQTQDDLEGLQYTLSCLSKGTSVKILNYGATITSISSPDRNGIIEEITLCYPTITELKTKLGPYFGCIAGRVANRIKEGKFSIGGENYTLPVNNGPNSLHGGLSGFDKKYWKSEPLTVANTVGAGVQFRLSSPDGDEGYPGALEVFCCLNYVYICLNIS